MVPLGRVAQNRGFFLVSVRRVEPLRRDFEHFVDKSTQRTQRSDQQIYGPKREDAKS